MDSMKQSAMSHKLIKRFPISLSYKELACVLTYGLSTSSSSSSTLKCASTKQPVVKAKRYSNLHKKCNTKIQLPVMKRTNPFFTTTMHAHMPSESTIVAPATRSFRYGSTTSPKFPSYDELMFCFSQTDLDSFLLEKYVSLQLKHSMIIQYRVPSMTISHLSYHRMFWTVCNTTKPLLEL